ncbi:hypothetical protein RCH23_003238 [Cryobacterium sp. CAN_C3]|uniref:hypothetical protein n=1 Tax=unclassified Cryobacterium TaxID=2649013 RepID=UPI0018C93FEA|nr:hypothetical protein [Cryobacterium sp. CAN_C3]MEC5155837.1 hypothetical protein [Cryobacterium sp. CAN_C3]
MEIFERFSEALLLLAGAAAVAAIGVFAWQFWQLVRITRAGRIRAKNERVTQERENGLRAKLVSQGYSESEADDAIRFSRSQETESESTDPL